MRMFTLTLIVAGCSVPEPPAVDNLTLARGPLHSLIHKFPGVSPDYLSECDARWDKKVLECAWRSPLDGGPCTAALRTPLTFADPCQFECRCGGIRPTPRDRDLGDPPPTTPLAQ
ncbi:MAG TPA: hypothetical protein PKA64_20195 [Myxococcota bacterium]|nr:hypothetical protein [Myxococcota bacterium]